MIQLTSLHFLYEFQTFEFNFGVFFLEIITSESDLENKNFWYDEPELFKREKICKAFTLTDKINFLGKFRQASSDLMKSNPKTALPCVKETLKSVRFFFHFTVLQVNN